MKFDETKVKNTLDLIKPDGQLCEVRIINSKKRITSGYFKSHEILINSLKNLHMDKCNVYLVLNTINESCYSREQRDLFIQDVGNTSDTDISSCEWFFVDVDPIRPTGISSTEEELQHSKVVAKKVVSYLDSLGFKKPIVAMSGNGFHLLYRIQLENSSESKTLVEDCLKVLSDMFTDDIAKIDTVNSNASRVCKLYGTLAQKGANTSERPHRMSGIVSAPISIEVTGKEFLESLSNQLHKVDPNEVRKNRNSKKVSSFDLDDFLFKNGITYNISNHHGRDNSIIYNLDECVFDPNHTSGDAKIFLYPDGAISYKCHHNSCSCYRWQDVRMKYDSDYDPDKDYTYNPKRNKSSQQSDLEDELPFDIDSICSIDTDEIDLDDIEEPEVIVKDLLTEGLFLLNAPAKNGKSRLTLQLLIDVCKGNKFLDYYDTNRCEVLYLALEDNYELDFKKRLKEFIGYSKKPSGFHVLAKTNFPPNKDNPNMRNIPKLGKNGGLTELIQKEKKLHPGIKLVAIDVFGSIRSEKQHKDFTLDERADIEELLNLASDLRICILVSHHVAKGSVNTFKVADSATGSGAGSYAISGSVIGELALIRDPKDRAFATLRGEGRRTPSTAVYLHDVYPKWDYVSTLAEHQKQLKEDEQSEEALAILETCKFLVDRDGTWKGTAKQFQLENESNADLPPLPKSVNKNSFSQLILHKLKMNGINYKQLKNGTAPVNHQFTRLHNSPSAVFEDMPVEPEMFDEELAKHFLVINSL